MGGEGVLKSQEKITFKKMYRRLPLKGNAKQKRTKESVGFSQPPSFNTGYQIYFLNKVRLKYWQEIEYFQDIPSAAVGSNSDGEQIEPQVQSL